ncbi:MAG: hypothetical protein C5B51_32165 [Terriglobia bacterium]|nr:MAG: hypothetical protein C5B51_32165 [Terriglobia bacterium]
MQYEFGQFAHFSMDQTLEKQDFNLDRWIGRREAFGLIAGRCSAAEVESLRRIRDERLYRGKTRTWDAFCAQHLGVSRRNVERSIRCLEEFGPAFFHLSQLAHIRPEEYRAIAPHITAEGVRLDGTEIALLPENSGRVSAAVAELLRRKRTAPEKSEPAAPAFAAILKRCEAAAEALETLETVEPQERLKLATLLWRIRDKAANLRVPIL